jgi:integrase
MSFPARGMPGLETRQVGRDRLELLRALINGPGFDPLYRGDMITIPADHPVYRWSCHVPECERAKSSRLDLCHVHQGEWNAFAARHPDGASRADFLAQARPLLMTEGFEPPACLACPGRPARVRGLGLCSRHQQRWKRHRDRGALPAGIEAWAALQDAFPGYGTCQTAACSRLATTPLGLCGFHERSYAEAGRPGGAGLPALWVRRCEEQGLPVPAVAGNLQEFRRWCARAGAAFNPGQVSLAGLRPLAKAELQWGMEAHARPREHTKWCVPWLRELARLCRDGDLDCLAGIDLSACPSRIRMIVGEILNRLRVVYYTKDDSRQAGFIETGHFGRRFRGSKGYYDLTGVPQRWLRDLLWDHMAGLLESVDCPRGRGVFDNLRRTMTELGAFLAVDAPDSGNTPSLLGKEHADRFVADQRHRALNGLPSLALRRSDGQPGKITSATTAATFTYCRKILYAVLESGDSDRIGLGRSFITAFPRGKFQIRKRRPFDDEVARALADEASLQRLDQEHDPFDGGVRDAWEALVATGRRCTEVLELRLNCMGRYGDAPMLWHDQAKVGNYDAGIRIPEYLFGRLDSRRRKTLRRFELRHGRPPSPRETAEMALFPSRVKNPAEARAISYSFFRRAFKPWVESLDLGECVPHQARHTLATKLLQAGATLAHVRKYLGQVSDRMAEHYIHIAGSDLDDLLARVWVAGPGAENPGEPLPGITTPLSRQAAEAMAVSIGRRCTPALGGLCTEQVVVDGGRCPKKNKLDCDNCDKLVMTGADLLYWRRKREQWHSIAERAPDDATAGYLHSVFEPTARAIDGLEKALAGLGLLDQALALDLRRPQDYFHRLWNTGFPVPALSAITDTTETETA